MNALPGEVTLSRRQRQILEMVAEDLTSKEIAYRLGLSFRTIEFHRLNIWGPAGSEGCRRNGQVCDQNGLWSRNGPFSKMPYTLEADFPAGGLTHPWPIAPIVCNFVFL